MCTLLGLLKDAYKHTHTHTPTYTHTHTNLRENLRVDKQDVAHGEEGGEASAELRRDSGPPLLNFKKDIDGGLEFMPRGWWCGRMSGRHAYHCFFPLGAFILLRVWYMLVCG